MTPGGLGRLNCGLIAIHALDREVLHGPVHSVHLGHMHLQDPIHTLQWYRDVSERDTKDTGLVQGRCVYVCAYMGECACVLGQTPHHRCGPNATQYGTQQRTSLFMYGGRAGWVEGGGLK